jgi:hypothetical protein
MQNRSVVHRLLLPVSASIFFLITAHVSAQDVAGAQDNAAVQNSVAADVADETREACAPEAMRLCADYIPDVPKITSCMEARFKEVSLPCRAAMIHEHYRARGRLSKSRVTAGD